jgi:hypothetical protein
MSAEGHLEGIPLARGALRVARVLQRDKDETYQRYTNAILSRRCRGLLDDASQKSNPEVRRTPSTRSTSTPGSAATRALEHGLQHLEERPLHRGEPHRRRLLHDRRLNEAVLNNKQTLPIEHDGIKHNIEKITSDNIELDKRFVYYLQGSTESASCR